MNVGEIVRRLHSRAWDPSAEGPEVSLAEVVAALPVLLSSGSAGIVWPRLRERFGADHPAGMALEAAAASQAAHNARAERELARVVERLAAHGVRPVLIKGLSMARLYPAGLVRPAGDLDMVVRDEDYGAARELLSRRDSGVRLSYHGDRYATRNAETESDAPTNVDLHAFSKWGQSPGVGFFERAHQVTIGDALVLVPSDEDHLRALCYHFLVHGATRPLRLCDIALLFESRPEDFDWDRLFRGSRRNQEYVCATLALADSLLGMETGDTPLESAADRLPTWLINAVYTQITGDPRRRTPLTSFYAILQRPWAMAKVARQNWPDPISATARLGAPINGFPRFPIQLAFIWTRLGVFTRQVAAADLRTWWIRRGPG